MNANWGLFVPTYKKKDIQILEMLKKDKKLVINLCVRPEEDDAHFYDFLKDQDRVNIIRLPYNLYDLGETRQAILDYCSEHNIKYCFQFDDGMTDVDDLDYLTDYDSRICSVFEHIVDIMEHDVFSEQLAGFTFTKWNVLEAHPEQFKDRPYFTFFASQAYCINVEFAKQHNIRYGRLDVDGFEDASFYGDTIKAGGIWAGRRNIIVKGCIPNKIKDGGNHVDQSMKQLEEKYDRCNMLTLKHLNYMMGVSLQKRYRSHIGGYMSFLIWDLDYFYKVMIVDRNKNMKIIEKRFEV